MKCVMLFGEIDVLLLARHASLPLEPWCTMIERGDTTRPMVVLSEPSEAVKEYLKKRSAENLARDNVGPVT